MGDLANAARRAVADVAHELGVTVEGPPPPSEERWPFDPPYTAADLPQLDRLHQEIGLGPDWLKSERRAEIEAGQ